MSTPAPVTAVARPPHGGMHGGMRGLAALIRATP